jgi:hypothetical protein
MNLQQKLEIAATSVRSIARHDDDDADVRRAYLDQLEDVIATERAAIKARVEARVAAIRQAAQADDMARAQAEAAAQ